MGYVNKISIGNGTHLIEPTLYATATKNGAAYTASIDNNFNLVSGVVVNIKFTTTNETNATLNINETGAKPIKYNGANIAKDALKAGHTYGFVYDETNWELIGDLNTNTDTQVIQVINHEDKDFPIILKNTNNTTNETSGVKYAEDITANPENGTITANEFIGNLKVNELIPINTITYPAYTCSADTESKGILFFGKVNITDTSLWQAPWTVHYRLYVSTTEASTQGWYDCSFTVNGSTVNYYINNNFYSTSYRPLYNHRLLYPKSGYSDYGAYLGVRIQSSRSPTSLARILKIELLETINCTVELLDSIKRFDEIYVKTNNVDASTIWYNTDYNGTDVGLRVSGNANTNDTGYYILTNGFRMTAGENKVLRYTLFGRIYDGTYESFTITSNSVQTTKEKNPHGFLPEGKIYWNSSSSDYTGAVGLTTYEQYHSIDYRYSFNIGNTDIPANAPTYIKWTYNATNGLLYLADDWFTTVLPTSEDNFIYQRIGSNYYGSADYRGSLLLNNPYYIYKNNELQIWNSTHLSAITGADNLKAIEGLSGTTGLLKKTAANAWTLDTTSYATAVDGGYLPLSGGVMTGNIRRRYNAASTDPMITMLSVNQDIILWEAGHDDGGGISTTTSNHYKLLYKGTGSDGNNSNYLQLIAHKSSDVIAVQIDEIGKITLPQMATGAADTPIYINSNGVVTAGTQLGASAYHADSYFAKASHGTHVTTATVKSALGTVDTTAKKFLKDTGNWTQVDWGDLTGKPTSFTPSSHDHNTISGIQYYQITAAAGKTYIGWVKFASCDLNDTNQWGDKTYDIFIDRTYNSPQAENYSLRINCGWTDTKIIQLGGQYLTQIIKKFRIVRDNTNHKAYFEYYVDPSYTTYQNSVNIKIIKYFGSNLTALNEVQTEEDSAFAYKEEISLARGKIVGDLSGNASSATAANLTTTQYGISYYSDTIGTFDSTGAGTSGQYLKSNGTSAPTWESFPSTWTPASHTHGNIANDGAMTNANRLVWTGTDKKPQSTYHYATTDKIAINSTSAPSYNLYVNGTTYFDGNSIVDGTIQTTAINYSDGTTARTMIQFLAGNTYGHTIKIGGGAATVIAAGESISLAPTTTVENLYLLADSTTYVYAHADTLANRVGFAIDTSGHIIPQKAEAANSNQQNLGASNNKWASIFGNTFDGTILKLHQGTAADPSLTSNARIEFDYSSGQPVVISYTPNDSYRNPAGLKIMGGTQATPAWLEVEGSIYADGTSNKGYRVPTTGNSTGSVGGTTTPVYVSNGVITEGTELKDLAYIDKPSSNETTTYLRGDGSWVSLSDMGLSNALHFIGITSTTLSNGSTTSTLDAKSTGSLTKTTGFEDGDVVMDGDQLREYVWSGSAWRLLGITTSSAYTYPNTVANNTWISQITQGTDGKITVTTGTLVTSGNWDGTANTATKLSNTAQIGAADRPVYFTNGGVPSATTYRMTATNTTKNTAVAIQSNNGSNELETGIWYVNGTSSILGQSEGAAIINKQSDSWISQIYQDYRTGQIALRGKNNGTWQEWRQVLDSENYETYLTGTYGIEIIRFT